MTVNLFDSLSHQVTWDCHGHGPWAPATLFDYRDTLCPQFDRALSALLDDLEHRGLLDETLVVWATEFGRTPFEEAFRELTRKTLGRGHQHYGFSMWLAGGGVKRGFTYGATDDFGMHAVESPVSHHDFHATILHLLGLDHKQLTYRHNGRDFRLTDVHGRVVHDLLV